MESSLRCINILVVDEDVTFQRLLSIKLCNFNARLKIRNQARNALNILQEGDEDFDILMTEACLPDMDVSSFVKEVHSLKPYLPIILLSDDGSDLIIQKAVQMGVSDFISKPVVKLELTMRLTLNFEKSIKIKELIAPPTLQIPSLGLTATSLLGSSAEPGKSASVGKKLRMNWTDDLHKKFELAVIELGLKNATATKILRSNVDGLSKYTVNSHLQKFRAKELKSLADSQLPNFVPFILAPS